MPRRTPGRRSRSWSASDAGGLPRSRTWRRRVESFWLLGRGGIDGQHRGPSGGLRAWASARLTMWPTAAGPVRPIRGAQIRRKTRRDALTPRSSRRYRARASPMSESSGKWSTIRPLPRTTISPARQRISSSSSETISPARRPSRASRSKMAWSRRPLSVDRSVADSTRSTSSGERNAGDHVLTIFADHGN